MPKKSSGSVADTNRASYSEYEVEEFTIDEEPYYLPIQDEIEVAIGIITKPNLLNKDTLIIIFKVTEITER